MKKSVLLTMLLVVTTIAFSQQTYFWNGSASTSWANAANWTPARTTPASNDVLVFNTSSIIVSDFTSPQTIGQLQISGNAAVIFQTATTRVLNIGASVAGNDFTISAGSSLTVQSTVNSIGYTLAMVTGNTAVINGALNFGSGVNTAQAHRLTTPDAVGVSFESGSSFTTIGVSSGSPFGTTGAAATNNNIIFKSGSSFNFGGGANPFGASAPASLVQFQSGSNFWQNSTSAPSFSGRYYANFILNASISSTGSFGIIDDLTIKAGNTFTVGSTNNRFSITGNITVEPTAAFTTSGPLFPDLLLIGTGTLQTIDFGASNPSFRTISVGADANVVFATSCGINPSTATSGVTSNIYGSLNLANKVLTGTAGTLTPIFISRSASTVATLVGATPLSANSNSIVTNNPSGISLGMLVDFPGVFPANTYIISTSSGTFTTSKYSIASATTGTAFNVTNGNATLSTSNSGGLSAALPGSFTYTLNGNLTFNAATTTPFPATGTVSPTNLTINANVTLNRDVSVTGVLTVGSGTLDLGANNITLVSTSTNTARVANAGASAFSYSGVGKFNLQRYIPGNRRAFRFLGNPFSNDIAISQLTNTNGANTGIDITGVSIGAIFGSGTAALTGDVVTSIAVDFGGFGYLSAPTVTLTGDGTGATATATVSSGSITGFTVTNGGSGYTAPPTVILTGGFGFTPTATNNPSAFKYDPVIGDAGTNPDPGWNAFTNATANNWLSKQGIRVLVRGTKGEGLTGGAYTPSATTITMTGTLNDGTSPAFNLTNGTNSNFNLIANPLASTIDMQALSFGGADVGLNYYVWDPNLSSAGQYVSRPFTAGATYRYLPMGSAFFATTASTGTITFPETAKATGTAGSVLRGTSAFGTNSMQLELTDNTGLKHDEIIVFLDNAASNNLDSRDAIKMSNSTVNFYSNSGDAKKLSIDARPFAINNIIPVSLNTTTDKDFIITASNFNVDDTRDILLHDKKTNTYTTLNLGVTYSFTSTLSDATSYGDRFELVMRAANALPTTFLNVTAAQKNAGIEVSWTTAKETNMSNFEVEESTDGNNFSKATSVAANNATTNVYNWFDANIINGDNYYRIKSVEKSGTAKYSNIVKVKLGTKASEFSVYPNPVKGGIVSLQMSNVEKGIYTVKIFNNLGQELAIKTINHNGGSVTQTIDLGKTVAAGIYKLQINNGTTSITKTVIVE
jgi:hypothetical protein